MNKSDKRRLLYNYWDKLQFLKIIDHDTLMEILQSEVKSFVLRYIRNGIEDEYGRENNLGKRHAFTVKELHSAFKDQDGESKFSIANFHFHIKSLVDDGLIQEISKILQGRHYVSYYGRTAIMLDSINKDLRFDYIDQNIVKPLKKFIVELNQDKDLEIIEALVNQQISLMEDYQNRLYSWLKDKYPSLYRAGFEPMIFMQVAPFFSGFHSELTSNSKKIASLLGLNTIENYERYKIGDETNE